MVLEYLPTFTHIYDPNVGQYSSTMENLGMASLPMNLPHDRVDGFTALKAYNVGDMFGQNTVNCPLVMWRSYWKFSFVVDLSHLWLIYPICG